jgi:NDP-sugar pyrophosphorylase family protein
MAGRGSRFKDAGYAFPKPLIDVQGKTMIEVVVNNLRPSVDHRFIFVVQKEHYDLFDLYNVLKTISKNKFEVVVINGITEGAACTVLTALEFINNDDDLLIANSDQFIETSIDGFVQEARLGNKDGFIMTFPASHPKWSYALTDENNKVLEVAEKKLISSHATVGIYYFRKGSFFVEAAQNMIYKNIRSNNEFYVCPVYNEMIIQDKKIYTYEIPAESMYGLGTPEDLNLFLSSQKEKRTFV